MRSAGFCVSVVVGADADVGVGVALGVDVTVGLGKEGDGAVPVGAVGVLVDGVVPVGTTEDRGGREVVVVAVEVERGCRTAGEIKLE